MEGVIQNPERVILGECEFKSVVLKKVAPDINLQERLGVGALKGISMGKSTPRKRRQNEPR